MPHQPRQNPNQAPPSHPSSYTVYDVYHLHALPWPFPSPRQSLLSTRPTLQEAQHAALQLLHTLEICYLLQGWVGKVDAQIDLQHSGRITGVVSADTYVYLSEVQVVARSVVVPGDGDGDEETESQGFLDIPDGSNRAWTSCATGQGSGTSTRRPSSAPQLATNTALALRNLTARGTNAPPRPTTPPRAPGQTIAGTAIPPQSPFATTARDIFNPADGPGEPHPRYLPQQHTLPSEDATLYHATLRRLGFLPRDESGATCGPGEVHRFVQDPLPGGEYARAAVESGMRYLGVAGVLSVRLPVAADGEGGDQSRASLEQEVGGEGFGEGGEEGGEEVIKEAVDDVLDEGYAPIKRWRSHSWTAPEGVMWQDVEIRFNKEI